MRLLSAYYTHKPGGFCKRLYRLLSASAASGTETHYLTLDPPPVTLDGVRIHVIPFYTRHRHGLLFWGAFTLWCPMYCAYKAAQLKPQRYLAFGAYYAACFRLAKWLCGGKIVLFLRALSFKIDRITEKPKLIRSVSERLEKFGVLGADTVVCMSEAMKSELEEFVGTELRDTRVLPNDIPQVKKSLSVLSDRLVESEFRVLTAGVIDQRKNIAFLLHVFAYLQHEKGIGLSQMCLLIAGDGPLLDECVELAQVLELDNVRFLGWVDDLARSIRSCSLLVHPSLHEGIPNVVLEAMAYDLPVLVSDIPELREAVHFPEITFDLLDPRDLAERILSLKKNPAALEQLRDLCSKRKQQLSFDWDKRALACL